MYLLLRSTGGSLTPSMPIFSTNLDPPANTYMPRTMSPDSLVSSVSQKSKKRKRDHPPNASSLDPRLAMEIRMVLATFRSSRAEQAMKTPDDPRYMSPRSPEQHMLFISRAIYALAPPSSGSLSHRSIVILRRIHLPIL
jgi:hypothetical protein